MDKKRKLLLGSSIIVVLLIYLFYSTVGVSNQYQVSEALAVKDKIKDSVIIVNGTMVKGSDTWDSLNRTYKFKMSDGIATMDVIYKGDKPNIPEEYDKIGVVVTGSFKGDKFSAYKLITKCPSKYESSSENIVNRTE